MPKKEAALLATYAPLDDCTEAGETFLGVVNMISRNRRRLMISLADSLFRSPELLPRDQVRQSCQGSSLIFFNNH
jgi:hypothetical protein